PESSDRFRAASSPRQTRVSPLRRRTCVVAAVGGRPGSSTPRPPTRSGASRTWRRAPCRRSGGSWKPALLLAGAFDEELLDLAEAFVVELRQRRRGNPWPYLAREDALARDGADHLARGEVDVLGLQLAGL